VFYLKERTLLDVLRGSALKGSREEGRMGEEREGGLVGGVPA
jgi:hypothetical protein